MGVGGGAANPDDGGLLSSLSLRGDDGPAVPSESESSSSSHESANGVFLDLAEGLRVRFDMEAVAPLDLVAIVDAIFRQDTSLCSQGRDEQVAE